MTVRDMIFGATQNLTTTVQETIKASDLLQNDYFGMDVCISADGTKLAVTCSYKDSAYTNTGAVYVFTRVNDLWVQQAKLTASNAEIYDNFGSGGISFDSSGTILVIGAPYKNVVGGMGGTSDSGAVYVFKQNTGGLGWSEQTILTAPDYATDDYFGSSVAISADGTTIAIGSPYDGNANGPDDGSVYVYKSTDLTSWTYSTRLQASTTADYLLGRSIAISGDGNSIIAGVDIDSSGYSGVYHFQYTNGSWSSIKLVTYIVFDYYGERLSISADGKTILIGAANTSTTSSPILYGKAYVYTRSSNTSLSWSSPTVLVGTTAASTGYAFGSSVALSADGKTAAIGNEFEGKVYVYKLIAGGWINTTILGPRIIPGNGNTRTGSTVSISDDGNFVATSSPYADNNGATTDSGEAYVFYDYAGSNNSAWVSGTNITYPSLEYTYANPHSFAVSGDGATLAISYSVVGAVRIYTLSPDRTWILKQTVAGSQLDAYGYSIALNLQGNTLAIGAPYRDNVNGNNAGSVYIYTYNGTTWALQTELIASDGTANDNFGAALALNSDTSTRTRLVICATGDTSVGTYSSAYVFSRTGTTWTQQQKLLNTAGNFFWTTAAISSDGLTIALGAPQAPLVAPRGKVYVYEYTTSWNLAATLQPTDIEDYDTFGASVAISGLLIAVGSPGANPYDSGAVYTFIKDTTWTQQHKITTPNPNLSSRFGSKLDLAYSGSTGILVVSAPFTTANDKVEDGSVFVFELYQGSWNLTNTIVDYYSSAASGNTFGNIGVRYAGQSIFINTKSFNASMSKIAVRYQTKA